jgi:hypothetical protein
VHKLYFKLLGNEESFLTHHITSYTLEMAHSSNVFINGSTFNSAQGDIHINNKDSGMPHFRSVQKSILIDNPMKDFIS